MARSARKVRSEAATARAAGARRLRERLVSVAGLVGQPVRLVDGREVARVIDVVVTWSSDRYPPVTGLVVKVGRRRSFIPMADLASVRAESVVLGTPRLDVRDYQRRAEEVLLMGDVVDHQLVDIDGVQVVRASDLYLAHAGAAVRLVGVEVGVGSLLRRLGPPRVRVRPLPERVIDWADIHPLGRSGSVLIERSNRELRRLRPGDLADLLEGLGQAQRHQLVGELDDDLAADVLEEMAEEQRDAVLRGLDADRAAAIVAEMEPDEAAEALRDLTDAERERIAQRLPVGVHDAVEALLRYPKHTAGGIMTTMVVTAGEGDTVAMVQDRLRLVDGPRFDVDAVLVVDADGAVSDDVTLFELVVARPEQTMAELVGPPWPIVVAPTATLDEVLDAVLSNRRSSVVVLDDAGMPLGRILADDVLDAVTSARGRLRLDGAER